MDDLCLSVRVFRQLNDKIPLQGNEWMENLPDFLETAKENVINQLSDIPYEELRNGFSNDKIGAMVGGGGNSIGTAPLARKDHFIYGILDLIQQHIQPIDSGKVNYKVMQFSIEVAKNSPYSYLRCKAFEVLAAMSSKPGIGQAPIGRVNELLAEDTWRLEKREKVANQWRILRKRAVDVDYFLTDLRNKAPSLGALTTSAFQVLTATYRIDVYRAIVFHHRQIVGWTNPHPPPLC
jgi:hypothetical protein